MMRRKHSLENFDMAELSGIDAGSTSSCDSETHSILSADETTDSNIMTDTKSEVLVAMKKTRAKRMGKQMQFIPSGEDINVEEPTKQAKETNESVEHISHSKSDSFTKSKESSSQDKGLLTRKEPVTHGSSDSPKVKEASRHGAFSLENESGVPTDSFNSHSFESFTPPTPEEETENNDTTFSSNSSSLDSSMALITPRAIQTMINAKPFSKPLTVRITDVVPEPSATGATSSTNQFLLATVMDDTHYVEAVYICNHDCSFGQTQEEPVDFVVSVKSYVTSEANASIGPFLCLVTMDLLRIERRSASLKRKKKNFQPKYRSFREGGAKGGTFLAAHVSSFSDLDLAGVNSFLYSSCRQEKKAQGTVQDFFEKKKRMACKKRRSTKSDLATTKAYTAALAEFSSTQLHVIGGSKQGKPAAVSLLQQLDEALLYNGDLSPRIMCQWHCCMCCERCLEKKKEDAATAAAVTACLVEPTELENMCRGVAVLKTRLLSSCSSLSCQNGVTFAAAVLFGVLDAHAFLHGNLRLALVAVNWALCKAGLPFCIALFTTKEEKGELLSVLEQTRRNIRLVARGSVEKGLFEDICRQCGGLLLPLVQFLMRRIAVTVGDFQKVLKFKIDRSLDEAEARLAREFREGLSRRRCMICFEDHPNMAALCCGTAVHLNCINTWLTNSEQCPQCRKRLPPLDSQPARALPRYQPVLLRSSRADDDENDTQENDAEMHNLVDV